jgi:hypothetical protein
MLRFWRLNLGSDNIATLFRPSLGLLSQALAWPGRDRSAAITAAGLLVTQKIKSTNMIFSGKIFKQRFTENGDLLITVSTFVTE